MAISDDWDFDYELGSIHIRKNGVVIKPCQDIEPSNNDSRDFCYWCKEKVELIEGFSNIYAICPNCKK
jgi:hypothetical protein